MNAYQPNIELHVKIDEEIMASRDHHNDGYFASLMFQQFSLTDGESVCVGKRKLRATVVTGDEHNPCYVQVVTADEKTLKLSCDDIDFAWGAQVTVGFLDSERYANRCTMCGLGLGAMNPRQLCGKTECYNNNEYDSDNELLCIRSDDDYTKIAPRVDSFCTGVVKTYDGVQSLLVQEAVNPLWVGRKLTFKNAYWHLHSGEWGQCRRPNGCYLAAVLFPHPNVQYTALLCARNLQALPAEVWRRIFCMAADAWDVEEELGSPMLLRRIGGKIQDYLHTWVLRTKAIVRIKQFVARFRARHRAHHLALAKPSKKLKQ